MDLVKGSPRSGLAAATLGFFAGFAAVALFGPTAGHFARALGLSPLAVGFLVAMPALSGSLLRIPFAAWVDTTGGRRPMLVLLGTSVAGMAGISLLVRVLGDGPASPSLYPVLLALALLSGCGIATFSVGVGQVAYWHPQRGQGRALAVYAGVGNLAPGAFSLLLPLALAGLGLAGSYVAWLALLGGGTLLYAAWGRNAPYFQYRAQGLDPQAARERAAARGQELFPAGTVRASLRLSARCWKTWALVVVYFASFGGFIGLTAWLPTYWTGFFGLSPLAAGLLTGTYSILASLVRVAGGMMADHLQEGGQNTAILGLFVMLSGSLIMCGAERFEMALPGVILLAFGMGLANAAVFKIVPQAVPRAVGGAAGWVGGLGAFGGFVLPPVMGFAVRDLGTAGYAIGFVVFVVLSLASLTMLWMLKYAPEEQAVAVGAGSRP